MIEDQLTSLTLIGVVLSLTILEKKRLNTLVTPFTVTAWPFVFIAVLVNFLLIHLDFKPFTMRAQLFILANLGILWVIGYIVVHFSGTKTHQEVGSSQFDNIFEKFAAYEWLLIGIAWFAIGVIFRRVNSLLSQYGGFAFVGDPRFEMMMMYGFPAHMGEVAKTCFLLLGIFFSFSKRKILVITTLLGLFIALTSMQVKYHLLWVLIMLFIYRVIKLPVAKQWRALFWTGFVVVLVMNLFWILLTIAWQTFSLTSKGIWQFLFEHTMLYVTSGPVAFDHWLDYANIKPQESLLVVFLNIKNVLLGNPLRISAMPYVNISFVPTAAHTVSNVGTAYGVYYIIGGWTFTLFMTVLLSSIYYLVFVQNRKRTNVYLIFINILCMTLAALTFFVQYFTLLSLYETILIYSVVITIFQVLNYLKMDLRIKKNDVIDNNLTSVNS
ncbi:MAG: O-antigen polymerase [Syntrophales bacterium]